MAENSHIEWTTHTFNPWMGCCKVSDGCKNCYAEALMDKRYGKVIWGPTGTRNRTSASNWKQPYKWDREAKAAGEPHRVFCASLADVFEDATTCQDVASWATIEEARISLFCMIENTPNVDWLLLTKRPQNIMRMVPAHWRERFPANVWVGTSVEDQKAADARIPILLTIPAVVRFLSCEPLISHVCLDDDWLYPRFAADDPRYFLPDGRGVDWVIIGGESGQGARPFDLHWAKTLVRQCGEVGVACFVKQLGANPVRRSRFSEDVAGTPESNRIKLVNTKGGDITEFPEDLQVREFPR